MVPAKRGQAIVIGASMAGLLTARVLADHFSQVTLLERDSLDEGAAPRKGVPQGRHAHGLLAGGQQVLVELFPGLVEDLVAAGTTTVDLGADTRWHQPGGYRPQFPTDLVGLSLSRPLLEATIRRRVLALPNVTLRAGAAVAGLAATADRGRVTGVTLRSPGAIEDETLAADLVVDAGGRGSHAPAWLEGLGYDRPTEERITIGVGYTTRLYRRRPGDLPGAKFVVIQPTAPRETRTGVLLPIEGDRWIVTLGGWLGDHAPADDEGFLAFARSLPAPDIYDVIKDAEPLGEAAIHKFPANLRRRYERLARLPEGYLAIGDALCSFNPIYGQGMSVAAREVLALAGCLREGWATRDGLPREFYRRAARVIDTPWQLAAGADFGYPGVTGRKAPGTDLINRYMGRVLAAATRDRGVCRALIAVTNLLAPPGALFAPRIVAAVLRDALRRPSRAASPAPGHGAAATLPAGD